MLVLAPEDDPVAMLANVPQIVNQQYLGLATTTVALGKDLSHGTRQKLHLAARERCPPNILGETIHRG
jgi:ABC-type protease/lipase transport system fused ATPase/permease subunit